MRMIRAVVTALAVGAAMGTATALVNSVPILLGEVGEARADRSGWSQSAEFVSLILDSGWAWAATAVLVGWLVCRGHRPGEGALVGALAGGAALAAATIVYDALPLLLPGPHDVPWGQVRFWLVASVLLGPPLGAVGATIRRPGPVGVLASLVVPIGAALNMAVLPPSQQSAVAQPVRSTVWSVAATAIVLVVARALPARRRADRPSAATDPLQARHDHARATPGHPQHRVPPR